MSKPANAGKPQDDAPDAGVAEGGSETKAETPASGTSSSPAIRSAKKIFVTKNGAVYVRPQRIVIPHRLANRWEAILQLLDDVCSVTGGVHRVIEAEEFKPATNYDELEDGKIYVLLNSYERIHKMDYQGTLTLDSSRSSSPRRKPAEPRPPPKNAGPKVPSRYAEKGQLCRFKIYVNKSNIVRPFLVNINMTELSKFSGQLQNKICSPLELVFRRIEQNCSLTLPGNKPIRTMYTLNGVPVREPGEMCSGSAYVVAGNEPFMDLHYEERCLKTVIHHGPVNRKQYENMKYLCNLPSADKERYGRQSKRAAEKRARKEPEHSDQRSTNGHYNDPYDAQDTPRNGDHYNGYSDQQYQPYGHQAAAQEEIPRFGEEGAPRLVEDHDDENVNGGGITARDDPGNQDDDTKGEPVETEPHDANHENLEAADETATVST